MTLFVILFTNRSKVFLSIERLLTLTCSYISMVEDGYALPRNSPPHGSCFYGFPIQIHATNEMNKTEVDLFSHSNETLGAVRQKIAKKSDCSIEAVQIFMNDKIVRFCLFSSRNNLLSIILEVISS